MVKVDFLTKFSNKIAVFIDIFTRSLRKFLRKYIRINEKMATKTAVLIENLVKADISKKAEWFVPFIDKICLDPCKSFRFAKNCLELFINL